MFSPQGIPYSALVCRYNEIGTKGKNRGIFEDQLADGLRRAFSAIGELKFKFDHGRIFILPGKGVFSEDDLRIIRSHAKAVAGLASVSPGFLVKPDLASIEEIVLRYFPEVYRQYVASPHPAMTYAMRSRRCDKGFPMTCSEMERYFAEKLLPAHPGLSIDLKHAELLVEVDIRFTQAFIDFERIPGPGGLPSGSGGHVLALLSGGIDSPVACYEMMRRGCTVDFITFNSTPYTPPAYITKVTGIARHLNQFQKRGRLVSVNLLAAQKEIRDKCQSRFRTVLYRRFMMRIASQVAKIFGDKALVTGENLGQVASQTLENMGVISQSVPDMILRPLLTFDKLDTIGIAREIGTYELSIEEVPDSCTVFAPPDPTTAAQLEAVLKNEELLDIPGLVRTCLEQSIRINPNTLHEHPLLGGQSAEQKHT